MTSGLANVDGYHLPHPTFEQLPFFNFLICQQEGLFTPLSGKLKFAELSTGSYAPPPHHWSPYFWQLEARGDWKAYPTFPSGAVSVLCGNQNLLRGVNCQCAYILKVKKFAESDFQSQKICGKSALISTDKFRNKSA